MKKEKILSPRKIWLSGQTMVEFALVLPILLTVVFGLMESGRLLFIYGSVTTASRQAVRYGSATGDNGLGTKKYLDCAGIQAAAEEMGFLLPIDTVDIIYTRGGTTFADCDTGSSAFPDPTEDLFQNGDRIEVTVSSAYSPMVPIGNFGAFTITTGSKRTIFTGISISVDPGEVTPGPEITLTGPADREYSSANVDFSFTFRLTNTSDDIDLTSYSVTTSPSLDGFSCSGGALAAGAYVDCTGTYTTTQTDEDTQATITIVASATASDGTDSTSASAYPKLTFADVPALTLNDITADPSSTTNPNARIEFTHTITNDGNIALSSFGIASTSLTLVSENCSSLPELAPDAQTTCKSTYDIISGDIDVNGLIHYAATLSANAGVVVSNEIEAIVNTKPLSLTLSTSPASSYVYPDDTEIEFRYTLQNTGTEDLTGFYIESALFGTITTCDGVDAINLTIYTLTPGESVICRKIHTLDQDDMDIGYVEDNEAIGYVTGGDPETSPQHIRVEADQNPALTLVKSVPSPDPATTTFAEDDVITYRYTLTNSGDVTLMAPYVITDDLITDSNIICAGATSPLPPDAATTAICTGTYTVTADDELAGSITNTATATATLKIPALDGRTTKTSAASSVTVYTYDKARLNVEISAKVGTTTVYSDATLDQYTAIIFTYTFTNTGKGTLTQNYLITDHDNAAYSFNCNGEISSDLLPHTSDTCSHTITASTVGTWTNTISARAVLKDSSPVEIVTSETPNPSMSFTITSPIPACTYAVFVPGAHVSYDPGDHVTYDSATWICTTSVNNSNKTPYVGSSYWTKVNDCTMP